MLPVKCLPDYRCHFVGAIQFLLNFRFSQLNFLWITHLLYLAKPQGAFEEKCWPICLHSTACLAKPLHFTFPELRLTLSLCLSDFTLRLFSTIQTTLCWVFDISIIFAFPNKTHLHHILHLTTVKFLFPDCVFSNFGHPNYCKLSTKERQWKKVKSLSRVWLFAIPWTVAHQALLSTEFSRQEYWSGLPFSNPGDLPSPEIKPVSCISDRFFTIWATRGAILKADSLKGFLKAWEVWLIGCLFN